MVEAIGTVVLSGIPSLPAAEQVLQTMTPTLWYSNGCEFLEKPRIEIFGSITTVDTDTNHVFKLVRNYGNGSFADQTDGTSY